MIATSPLTGRIYSGRASKDGSYFVGDKKDVTSEVLKAILDKAAFHGGLFEIVAGDDKWIVKVDYADR